MKQKFNLERLIRTQFNDGDKYIAPRSGTACAWGAAYLAAHTDKTIEGLGTAKSGKWGWHPTQLWRAWITWTDHALAAELDSAEEALARKKLSKEVIKKDLVDFLVANGYVNHEELSLNPTNLDRVEQTANVR